MKPLSSFIWEISHMTCRVFEGCAVSSPLACWLLFFLGVKGRRALGNLHLLMLNT